MAETIEEVSYNYEDEGKLVRKEIKKETDQLLELADYLFQLAAQHVCALCLFFRRPAFIAIHIAVKTAEKFAQALFTGDRAPFFGCHNLAADCVRVGGQPGEPLL